MGAGVKIGLLVARLILLARLPVKTPKTIILGVPHPKRKESPGSTLATLALRLRRIRNKRMIGETAGVYPPRIRRKTPSQRQNKSLCHPGLSPRLELISPRKLGI